MGYMDFFKNRGVRMLAAGGLGAAAPQYAPGIAQVMGLGGEEEEAPQALPSEQILQGGVGPAPMPIPIPQEAGGPVPLPGPALPEAGMGPAPTPSLGAGVGSGMYQGVERRRGFPWERLGYSERY